MPVAYAAILSACPVETAELYTHFFIAVVQHI